MSLPPRPYDNRPPTGVRAKPVINLNIEYTSCNDSVAPACSTRPMLIENMINQRNVNINVLEGYDPKSKSVINQHSIYHLYEFESKTRFLDRIPRPRVSRFTELKTRFLCCRYVLCAIDDVMQKQKPMELMAIRLNGDIYIGANKSMDLQTDKKTQEAAFGGLNFAMKVTRESDQKILKKHHSVVKQLRIENTRNSMSMSIFVSSVARAFDQRGNVVELKTVGSKVMGKVQNLSRLKARDWWLRALLSGADRIVYGLRMDNMKVNEIHEAQLTDFTKGHFRFDGAKLFSEIFKIFSTIDKIIGAEGDMCMVKSDGSTPISVTLTTRESLKRSPFW